MVHHFYLNCRFLLGELENLEFLLSSLSKKKKSLLGLSWDIEQTSSWYVDLIHHKSNVLVYFIVNWKDGESICIVEGIPNVHFFDILIPPPFYVMRVFGKRKFIVRILLFNGLNRSINQGFKMFDVLKWYTRDW